MHPWWSFFVASLFSRKCDVQGSSYRVQHRLDEATGNWIITTFTARETSSRKSWQYRLDISVNKVTFLTPHPLVQIKKFQNWVRLDCKIVYAGETNKSYRFSVGFVGNDMVQYTRSGKRNALILAEDSSLQPFLKSVRFVGQAWSTV